MYGWDTKSWRGSAENHAMQRECAETTKRYEQGTLKLASSEPVYPLCHCNARHHAHTAAEVHPPSPWPKVWTPSPQR
jgi:hypothetical protein